MKIFSSILICFATLFFGFIIENYVSGGYVFAGRKFRFFESWKRTAQVNGPHHVARIIAPAVLLAVMYYFATAMGQLWWLSVIFVVLIAGIYFVYVKWYLNDVTEWKEWAFFQPLFSIPFIVLLMAAKNIAAVVQNSFWASVLHPFLPWAILTVLLLGALVIFLRKRAKNHERTHESAKAKKEKVFSVIVAILLVIALVLESIFLIAWPKSNGGNQPTAAWPYFFNLELQTDNDEGNDFNFGSSSYNKNWSAKDYDRDLRDRMLQDPALGAADIAYFDAIVGTPYLGEFYQSCKQDWAKAINAAKAGWINDYDAYKRTLIAFFACLDKAEPSVVESGKQIVDQMFMVAYTTDMVPVVIVMKTQQQDGPFLVYTLSIKGNTFKVAYRIPCGYQPTNVQLVMGIKPQPKPDKTAVSGGGKGGSGSKTTTNPAQPTTNPTQPTTKKYVKDPKKSTAVGNDVRGPGEDTNSGGNSSTKDRSTNSNHMSSYEKYVQDMKNNNQEANTTTSPSSYPGNRDSNEGEASKPTPTKPKPSEAATDPPAQQWSGPSD